MIRFAWLQARAQTLVVAAALLALVVIAVPTGIQLAHLSASLVAHCKTSCDLATNQFLSHQSFMQHALDVLSRVAPPLIGVFWGAPLLARELETGTHRLVWTQSMTRTRWLLTKLALLGAIVALLSTLLTVTISWWYRSLDLVGSNRYQLFDRRDVVPVAYALFAFAAGVLAGAIVRRVVPAMGLTLVVYVLVAVASFLWVRPHLLPPQHTTIALTGNHVGIETQDRGQSVNLIAHGEAPKGSWTISNRLLDSAGHHPSSTELAAWVHVHCPALAAMPVPQPPPNGHVARVLGPDAGRDCIHAAEKSFHVAVTYLPADRYWTLQWLESGELLALALLAGAGSWWWVTRRTR